MTSKPAFKWRHFLPEIINRGVRWDCSYPIGYRNKRENDEGARGTSGPQHAKSVGFKGMPYDLVQFHQQPKAIFIE